MFPSVLRVCCVNVVPAQSASVLLPAIEVWFAHTLSGSSSQLLCAVLLACCAVLCAPVQAPGSVAESVQGLADEVAAWMGVGDVVVKGRRALPASSLRQQ